MTHWLSVRLMIETPDLASAAAAAATLCPTIARFGELTALEIDRYWKIDRYFEAVIVLQVDNPGDALRRLAEALAPDWQWGPNHDWAVWDLSSHGAFNIQSIAGSCRWAHVDILPGDPDRQG